MNLADITPLILTYNEEPNIARCLDRLRWASQVLILDSFSTDPTESIARSFPNVTFSQRKFDDHASQWNHGAALVTTPWILALDADYILTEGFEDELAWLQDEPSVSAYRGSFFYAIHGRPLRGSLYPPRVVLYRKDCCVFERDGHTQALRVTGDERDLQYKIVHDDRKPLSRWFSSQDKYSVLEAEKLSTAPVSTLPLPDRIRRTLILGPFFVLLYTLFVRGTLLDGWRGWYYTFQRVLAEIILSLRLLERKFENS